MTKTSLWGIYRPAHKFTLLTSDICVIALSFYLASQFRLGINPNYFSLEYTALSLIIVSTLFLGNGYTSNEIGSKPRLPLNTFFVAISSSIPCMVFIYVVGPEKFNSLFGRAIFPISLLLTGIFTMFNRLLFNKLFNSVHNDKKFLFIGNQSTFSFVNESVLNSKVSASISHLKHLEDITALRNFDLIIISPEYKPIEQEQQLLLKLRLSGTPIFSLSDFFENFLFLIPVNKINKDWFIRSEGFSMLHSIVAMRLKRATDIVLSVMLILITMPVFILSVGLIKLSSAGPVFFSQKRVGYQGVTFTIYKLRSMHVNAERGGAQWAASNDNRIFKFGHFLRTSRIDELPQCWNVLKGDMSFVGPRPERPEFTSVLAEKIPYYDLRNIVKPGLTGWAQVSYPYGASVEDSLRKLQYDLYYIKNYSLLLDLNILLRTVLVTLRRSGR